MSKLFVVPTPIGNLGDMTYRAVEVLSQVDLILAEDTRQSKKLLKHYNINSQLASYHKFNEHYSVKRVIDQILSGVEMALISDAGTPGISDPGFLLVRSCLEEEIEVECLPGATAFVPALINSGFPTDKFYFEGFLPHKKGRKSRLEYLSQLPCTIVLYESPHRIIKLLENIKEYFNAGVKIAISRELTKMHEEKLYGTADDLISIFMGRKPKGEFVVCINNTGK